MRLDFMTPDIWNGLILGVVLVGMALAVLRLYSDLTRPLPPASTKPTATRPVQPDDPSDPGQTIPPPG